MKLETSLSYATVLDKFYQIYQVLIPQLPFTLGVILRKIGTNLFSANLLIESKHYNEACIIIRSATESVILFCYLTEFPDKIQEYVKDCQMLRFKNHFIAYKKYKEAESKDYMQDVISQFSEEELIAEQKRLFDILHEDNKKIILKKINKDKYTLNDKIVDKLDNFFRKELKKPFFMKLEKMYNEILSFKVGSMELRDFLYQNYNLNSQTTHGEYFDWIKINPESKEKLGIVDSSFKRVIYTIILQYREACLAVNEELTLSIFLELENISDRVDNYFITN